MKPIAPQGMKVFVVIWTGQVISMIGSGLTSFALGVWVYQQTGSATQFALTAAFASIPALLLLPLAGAFVDSRDKRAIIIIGNLVFSIGKVVIAVLFARGQLHVWHIYVALAIGSGFAAAAKISYATLVTVLVPKDRFGHANGMLQVTQASTQVFPPLIAGNLITTIGISNIIAIDIATYLVALVTLLIHKIPAGAQGPSTGVPLFRRVAEGWQYIKARTGLVMLLVYFAGNNFVLEGVLILLTPMLLSFSTPRSLGFVLSASGLGFLLGSIMMSFWGGPIDRIKGMLGFSFLLGLATTFAGLRPRVELIAVSLFAVFFLMPIINGCSQTIWQLKTPLDLQGRVFALRRVAVSAIIPVAYLLSGVLADRVFEPLMAMNGALSSTVGAVIGHGPASGIRLMFIVSGICTMCIQVAAYLTPPLLNIEQELPDAPNWEHLEEVSTVTR